MPISAAGVETAIAGLRYRNPSALKSRLLAAIAGYYEGVEFPESVRVVPTDDLIQKVWELENDPAQIISKRKNFNSIKSAINADLKRAWQEGNNPEGITIGPENMFAMSREAKDQMLDSISESVQGAGALKMEQIGEALKLVSAFLSSRQDEGMPAEMAQLQTLVEKLTRETGKGDLSQYDILKKGEHTTGPVNIDQEGKAPAVSSPSDSYGDASHRMSDDMTDGVNIMTDAPAESDDNKASPDAFEVTETFDPELEEEIEMVDADAFEDMEEIDEIEEKSTDETDEALYLEEFDSIEEFESDTEAYADEQFLDNADLVEEVEAADEPDGIESDAVEEIDGELIEDVDVEAGDEAGILASEIEVDEIVEGIDEVLNEASEDYDEILEDEAIEDEEGVAEEADGRAEGAEPDRLDSWMEEIGLPIGLSDEEKIDFENTTLDSERKKNLAARFDGFLGAMERYYNQFATVPKGTYRVGDTDTADDVLLLKQVSLGEYYMGKFPVTNAVFEVFVDRTGYVTTAEKLGYGTVYYGRFQKIVNEKTGQAHSRWRPTHTREKVKGATWYQPLGPGSNLHNKRNHPVVQVSLQDAMSFAAWTGKRLPSEIEWEAAARSPDGRLLPWGKIWLENCCNIEGAGISDTTPVDQYINGENPFGIVDLLGNVLEWTSDPCQPKFSLNREIVYYIAKGGGWIADQSLRLTTRHRLPADFSANILGFRCLID
ncbi:MAG: SUMF1/EgtB/PvdO family nonheme iron enzyme [Desulfobacterales bacterium]|jgi:formylglycine-generating enzyme required for sulfatase activity|nr:SUMF1/EgtB/PvdO family nonheme iron enzyme [Desulfobacterales bacterium]